MRGRAKHLLIPERVGDQWRVRRTHQSRLDRWPVCAKCGRAVKAYNIEHKGSKHWDIAAKCHGEVEVQTISWEHWSDAEPEIDVIQNHIAAMEFFKRQHWEVD